MCDKEYFQSVEQIVILCFWKTFFGKKNCFRFLLGINFNKEISNQIPKKDLFWGFCFILSNPSVSLQNKHPMFFIQKLIPHFSLEKLFWGQINFYFSSKSYFVTIDTMINPKRRSSKSFVKSFFSNVNKIHQKACCSEPHVVQTKKKVVKINYK